MKNKKLSNPGFRIAFIVLIIGIFSPAVSQNLLNAPECTVYDQAHHRYLVSCYQSGAIVQIDSTGLQSYFRAPSGNLLSNTICGNTLYVSAITGIKAFDLDSGDEIWNLDIPGSHQLDGMTCDNSGYLYVADFHYAGNNDQVYKINLADHTWSVFVAPGHGLCQSPQDVIYDPDSNRLLVACYYNAPIQAISLADSTVSTVVVPPIGNFDGIARDNDGNFYLTSWTTGGVHRYGPDFTNPPELIRNGLLGPANLSFNPVDNVLAVPEFDGDSVVIIPVFPVSVPDKETGNLEVFPNPCNGKFQICLNSQERGTITVSLYSIEGRMISSFQDNKTDTGFTRDIYIENQTDSVIIVKTSIGLKEYWILLVNLKN
ncbi:MAG: SMP-30/gluconolactonase/LRE family protein [Bacteroidetes bacterium]|nr:SMP-30/gluconolactonase/LRE family protein [Bacteroidota bacterium]